MDAEQLREIIGQNRETRSVEFKRPMPWDDSKFKAKIVKSVLAMSNLRDGGVIIIGVEEQDDKNFVFTGMSDSDAVTWDGDHIASHVSDYADPFVELTVQTIHLDKKRAVAIIVSEFEEVPVLCKEGYGSILSKGTMYCRTYRMPESAPVPSQTEMREIMELASEKHTRELLQADRPLRPESVPVTSETEMREILSSGTEKRTRQFLQTASRVGLIQTAAATDSDEFDAELGDFS